MKLYVSTKTLTLEDGDHEIVLSALDKQYIGYNYMVDSDKVIKKDKKFLVREQNTWDSFPLYEIIDNKLVDLDYTKYSYFIGTKRRRQIAKKIMQQFNPSAEAKILRTTLKCIMDTLNIEYPDSFIRYNNKIEEIINKNLKEK